ncbi:MAG: rhodanese-related sulfurtransferase [Glaciecola sp.]|jgi:rhodanese-related sulfurtransferase
MEQLTVSQAIERAAQGAVLLDVREAAEWDVGHADGALHIPMSTIATRLDELPADTEFVCVCRSGGRSTQVAKALETRGLVAHNLDGGMQAWEADGHDVVTDDGAAGWVG